MQMVRSDLQGSHSRCIARKTENVDFLKVILLTFRSCWEDFMSKPMRERLKKAASAASKVKRAPNVARRIVRGNLPFEVTAHFALDCPFKIIDRSKARSLGHPRTKKRRSVLGLSQRASMNSLITNVWAVSSQHNKQGHNAQRSGHGCAENNQRGANL